MKYLKWTLGGLIVLGGLLFLYFQTTSTVKIAFVGELSTEKSQLSIESREGFDYAIQEKNKQGGLLGKKIVAKYYDDRIDNNYKETLYEQLKRDGQKLIIGFNVSSMKPTIDYLKAKKEFLIISPTASTDQLSRQDDLFIRVNVSNAAEVPPLLNSIKAKGITKVGLIYNQPNAMYAKELNDMLVKTFKEQKIQVLFDYPDEAMKHTDELEALVQTPGLQAIVAIVNSGDLAKLTQIVHIKSDSILLYGTSWAATNDFIVNAGRYTERTLLLETPRNTSPSDAYGDFNRWIIEKTGKAPTFPIEKTYNACKILFEGIEKANTLEPEAVKNAIVEQGLFQGIESNIQINKYGDTIGEFKLVKVKGTTFKRVDGQ